MTKLSYPAVIRQLIEEHFEELDFLWEQRESVLSAPDWTLGELAELEERAESHLDGLRLAAGHAVDIARPALSGAETFAATAATLVFMETRLPELAQELLAALADAEAPETRDGIRIGLRHSNIDAIRADLLGLAAEPNLELAAVAADVLTFHGVAVPDLERLTQAEEPGTRILAYRALGRQAKLDQPSTLSAALEDDSRPVQRAALEAAAMSGMSGLEELCLAASSNREAPNLEALAFLGVLAGPAAMDILALGAREPERAAAAIEGLGALGNVHAVPLLIELMGEDQECARAAADAFMRITGLDDLAKDEPAAPSADEAQDDGSRDDGDEDLDFEDEAPAPDPAKAEAWWTENRERFDPGGAWQRGIEVSEITRSPAFDSLPLQVRRDLFLTARAAGEQGTPRVEL
jgi:uncharacterized protein (TIGR02270 family)